VACDILKLLCQLHTTISDRDFSQLAVWQAYLQDVSLHRVNFTQADLTNSVFAESIGSILSVAFSSNGKVLAIGDVDDKIRLWQAQIGIQQFTYGHTD
jgi:WD40 repeat protein